MENSTKVGYVCAGLGLGGALGMLFAPRPGAETRDQLLELAERGRDRVTAGARDVREAFERREEILHAGKKHLSQSVDAGRSAYQEATSGASTTAMSSVAAIGLLVFEMAALTAGYRLAAGLHKKVGGVGPNLESLLDASRTALADGSRQIASVASKVHQVLNAVEEVVHGAKNAIGENR